MRPLGSDRSLVSGVLKSAQISGKKPQFCSLFSQTEGSTFWVYSTLVGSCLLLGMALISATQMMSQLLIRALPQRILPCPKPLSRSRTPSTGAALSPHTRKVIKVILITVLLVRNISASGSDLPLWVRGNPQKADPRSTNELN